jgi:hypothetical protein
VDLLIGGFVDCCIWLLVDLLIGGFGVFFVLLIGGCVVHHGLNFIFINNPHIYLVECEMIQFFL